jgi:hypothetical protein
MEERLLVDQHTRPATVGDVDISLDVDVHEPGTGAEVPKRRLRPPVLQRIQVDKGKVLLTYIVRAHGGHHDPGVSMQIDMPGIAALIHTAARGETTAGAENPRRGNAEENMVQIIREKITVEDENPPVGSGLTPSVRHEEVSMSINGQEPGPVESIRADVPALIRLRAGRVGLAENYVDVWATARVILTIDVIESKNGVGTRVRSSGDFDP